MSKLPVLPQKDGIHFRILFSAECPLLSDIENGNVDMSKGRTAGSIATYICENNYALIGKPVRKCLPTGKWKGVEPLCVIGRRKSLLNIEFI